MKIYYSMNSLKMQMFMPMGLKDSNINDSRDDSNDSDTEDTENSANLPDDDFLNESTINLLKIQKGTNTIPHYSCAAHKINLVRILGLLAKLSKYSASVRPSTIISYDFTEKRQNRCQNGTRWSSSYLMLQSFFKAYEKSAFPTDKPCPYVNAEDQTQTVNPVNQRRVPIHNTENSVLKSFLNSVSYESNAERNRSSVLEKINREKEKFLDFIRVPTSQQKSTKEFWNENSYRFPILSQIACILFSIPASSAFVERNFSICGIK
ncbi:hypothetical protein BpHYR1_048609 [Brachionus plicatilis]|uniref:HAT C-terminal dimerisation domain-containing protein n=1 Tax=Brachionus plicatilis TaxID=10195 RepID=A0A3M7PRF8_BRAPC|nr:hypothetical protein BpHYR1_048609 [Brachionus plicatilis]